MAVTPRFSVRIPPDVRSAAEARAEREHRSLSDVIVRLLRDYGSGAEVAGVPLYPHPDMPGVLVATDVPALTPEPSLAPPRAAGCRHPGVRPKNRCPACGGYNIG